MKKAPKAKTPIKVVIPELLKGFSLYSKLSKAGFPQGGVGTYLLDKNGENQVYQPHASEIYQTFVADPEDWQELTDAMARIWLKNKTK